MPPRRGAEALLVVVALALGVALRVVHLDRAPLSIDEAETTINALTILERGVPADRYAGQPIFENTLLVPWPESPEYEFRDLSYSARGLAVYHGWLPLYATAASCALFGVTPDPAPAAGEAPRARAGAAEARRRALAARAPAALFGALFLAAAWAAGRAMLGRDAALLALSLAAVAGPCVRVAREARYYSATLLLSTLCCLLVWRLGARGRARDGALLGLGLAALFHTHALTFAAACAVAALWLPLRLRRRAGAAVPLGLAAGVTALGVAPWLLATGALPALSRAPAARSLLAPGDLLAYALEHRATALLALAAACGLGLVLALGDRLRGRARRPALATVRPTALLLAWGLAVAGSFLLLVPAASCFLWRLTLGLQGPGLVLAAVLGCAAARALGAPPLAAALLIPPLLLPGTLAALPAERPAPLHGAAAHLRGLPLTPGARLYATPDQHLPLTVCTGLPVQSIAPVRREFLDSFQGELVFVDAAAPRVAVAPGVVLEEARARGVDLDPGEARAWAARLGVRALREDAAAAGARVEPRLEPLPGFAARALARARALGPPPRADGGLWQNPAVFRGHEVHTRRGFWQVFSYRFVDPAARSGERANVAARLRGASATVLPGGWVVYRVHPTRRSIP